MLHNTFFGRILLLYTFLFYSSFLVAQHVQKQERSLHFKYIYKISSDEAEANILHKKDFIVPIPGARKPERIQENFSAADVELTDNEFNQIEAEIAKIQIQGNRTDEDIAKLKDMI